LGSLFISDVSRQGRTREREVDMAGWRGFAPAMGGPKAVDVARAGIGAGVALLMAGLAMRGMGLGWLIAPFGASAVLVYAVPNSPLAQPWSVVMGNTLSALVALGVLIALPQPEAAVPLAVGLAIAAMLAARALHPPGGAVALLVALGGACGLAGNAWDRCGGVGPSGRDRHPVERCGGPGLPVPPASPAGSAWHAGPHPRGSDRP
jgi:CBS-domain-containing membrane protein